MRRTVEYELPVPTPRARELYDRMLVFMREEVLPAEAEYLEHRRAAGPDGHEVPPVVETLKQKARQQGLWNLFLPAESGLSQLEYAPIAELSGWSLDLAPEAINGAAPDTGNMELLHLLGTEQQKQEWLEPLLAGEIRSAFAMTEPDVASSDATNIATRIDRDGDEYVITGRKWWTSGAMDPRCAVLIVMGKTDPNAPAHRQQTMVLVPRATPGVTVVRDYPVLGHHDQHGHAQVRFDGVRVPVSNVVGEEGGGFAAAQARLGPGRIHHCMRALGAAERALALLVQRAQQRIAFGGPLADQGLVQQQVAESRLEIEQARLLCHHASHVIDTQGNKAARTLVAMAKVAVPRAATA
jgi:acyl-CoA dehydrogenase